MLKQFTFVATLFGMSEIKLSVVSPVYKAEKIVDELVRQVNIAASAITDSYEIILVEDAGPDNSWNVIVANAVNNKKG